MTDKQAQQEVAAQVRAILTERSKHLELWQRETRWDAADLAMMRFWLKEAITIVEEAYHIKGDTNDS